MSLVIFRLLFSFVDYVPVKGEIIWYLSLTAWLIPFAMAWMELESIMLSEIEDESLALNGLGTSKEVKA